jgi:hypothetical protein
MPRVLHKKVKKIADDRDSSMNILVNTALAHWLARKGATPTGISRPVSIAGLRAPDPRLLRQLSGKPIHRGNPSSGTRACHPSVSNGGTSGLQLQSERA